MEFDERKIKPDSTRKFLHSQVEEQSDVCDVTVTLGQWERKYHRCVLMASPFFESVLKNDFLEKTSGKITLHHGSSTYVDMALMFLYGKKPKLNSNNIEDVLDMAEFFLIPNLKAACNSWLKQQTVTEETCLSLIQLSSKYGFPLESSMAYLESHLIEVLQQPAAVTLTFESVDYILSEKKFIYLPMEERLRFVVRWFLAHPEDRKVQTKQLIVKVGFNEISESCLNDLKCNPLVDILLRDMRGGSGDDNQLIDVLIYKQYGAIFCYDLSRDTWFQIQPDTITNAGFSGTIADTNPDASEVYLYDHRYNGSRVHNYRFVSDEMKELEVVTDTGEPVRITKSNFDFKITVSVFAKADNVHIENANTASTSLEDKIRLLSLFGPINNFSLLQQVAHDVSSTRKKVTTVYIGQLVDEKIQMRPMFSLSDFDVASMTSNINSVVALISRSCLVLYDTVNCTIDKIQHKLDYSDKIFPDQNGFIIHNNKRCITIRRISGPDLSNRYEVKEMTLNDDSFKSQVTYYYCNNTWFRYGRKSYESPYQFQCVEHDTLQEASSPSDVVWKELSLPRESEECSSSTIEGLLHFLRLPKRLLRCPVDCAHCKAKKQTPTVARSAYYDDDRDDYYDDSDDDDYYGGYNMYDSDDYYYYSSD